MEALLIFRHGQTEYNRTRRFQGQSNIPLNEVGHQQAARTGELVSNCLRQFFHISSLKIEALTSDLSRASETARTVRERVEANLKLGIFFSEDVRLREWDCGNLANYTIEEYEGKFPGAPNEFYAAFEKDPIGTPYPEGECKQDILNRLQFLLKPLLEKRQFENRAQLKSDENYTKEVSSLQVISSHGGIIHVLLDALGCAKAQPDHIIGNGDVLLLIPSVQPPRWKIFRHYKVGDNRAANIARTEV